MGRYAYVTLLVDIVQKVFTVEVVHNYKISTLQLAEYH